MRLRFPPRSVLVGREGLAARAQEVLRRNDMGGWTRAASDLYPQQWSWDTGFIAIGLAHLDTHRAAQELLTLFQHQWKTGKVPHIVFNPEAPPHSRGPPENTSSPSTSPATPTRRRCPRARSSSPSPSKSSPVSSRWLRGHASRTTS
jgi:hypothetical protein